ncbi:ribulose-phosphate 3-epimerase [soil metagenome]
MTSAKKLAPSILAADFARLGEQIEEAEAAGADYLHIDVMDGHFVPNLSLGPLVVAACRRVATLPLDVHLMIERPERYLDDFAAAGADILTVHAEATPHLHRVVERIRALGLRPGLAVNPLTPLMVFREALPYLGLALLMSVDPGFGGQRFIPSSLSRLETLRGWRDELNPDCELEIDGGGDASTIAQAARAGADVLVAGSAVFGAKDTAETTLKATIADNLKRLRDALP